MKATLVTRVALSLAVLLASLYLVSTNFFFHDMGLVQFSVALSSILFLLLRIRPKLWEAGALVMCGLLYALLTFAILRRPESWEVWLSCFGVASFVVLVVRVFWTRESVDLRMGVYTLIPGALFFASDWSAGTFLYWTLKVRPKVLDLYLYAFDSSLYVQLSFVIGQWLARVRWLNWISIGVYASLAVAMALVYAGCLMNDRKSALPAFVAMLITGPVGILFYNLFPALGPVYIFGRGPQGFPWNSFSPEQVQHIFIEPIRVVGLRNAMPSLHMTWAIMLVWFSRRLSSVEKIGAYLFLVFTVLATLGLGEHYFIDLVVAVPYALFILALTNLGIGPIRKPFIAPALAGVGMVLAWFYFLRFDFRVFWESPLVPWSACIATLVASSAFAKKLKFASEVAR